MRQLLETISASNPLVCCCCSSEGVEATEGKKTMELAPTFQLWRNMGGVAPATVKASGGGVSPSRLPSTKLITGTPASRALTIVSSLATTDQTVLRSERRDLAFNAGVKVIPHPDKVAKGGEDAYFISSYNGGVLGVADGVSGWAEENVDPALFSKELMAHALAAVEAEEGGNDPRQVLAKAHSSTVSTGAATAIVAILEKKGILHVANVGDCGLRIVRQGKVVYATAPQQHYFDCPYQLSSENAQTADDATVYELGVLEGDIIVMGSDGLFDNVFDSEIETTMQLCGRSDEDFPSRAALALASLACKHAKDRNFDSPYAKEAARQGNDLPWWAKVFGRKIGGKIDDITVVVGHIIGTPVSADDDGVSEKEEVVGHIIGTPVSADDDGVSEKEDKADFVARDQGSTEENVSKEQIFREEQFSKVAPVSTVDAE